VETEPWAGGLESTRLSHTHIHTHTHTYPVFVREVKYKNSLVTVQTCVPYIKKEKCL